MGLGTLHAGLLLLLLLLLLCLVRGSLQGGAKLQANGALGHLYLLSLIQGASGVHTGAILRLSGAKAALHLGYGPQGLQPEPGAQNGFRLAPAVGVKLGKAGYGIRGGYAAGLDGYAWGAKKNPGYVHTTLPLGGIGVGGKGPKAGYPGVGSGYLASRAQPGYGNGLGQLLYNGQTQQATPTGVGGDDGAGEYGGAGALMYRVQQSGSRALNGNGNGLGYANGGDLQANGLARGGYGRRTARQGPRGYRLTPAAYGSKEAKYGLNGFLGNGYRGHCTPRKC